MSRPTIVERAGDAAADPMRDYSPPWPTGPKCAMACASKASTFPTTPGSSADTTTHAATTSNSTISRRFPPTHQTDLGRIRESLDKARALNAQERARRFESCPPNASPEAALRHVEERSEHLAEPRPEYGHCTNSVCIVGRRSLTRGLFLDRRAFLVSYDAGQDAER